jgi:nucleotide-binding universal stress UspA family protein
MTDFDEILVPVDGSEGAHRAARAAAKLARSMQVPLTLLYAAPLTAEAAMAIARLDREEIETLQRQRAGEILTAARAELGEPGVAVAEEVLLGDPAEEILAYLASRPGAMAVMGRRGLSAIKTLLLGSVSDKVVRHATNPVLIIN